MNLTEAEAAERLRLKPKTLEGWRNRRKGPPYFKFGKRVLYPLDRLIEWEKSTLVETR